MKFMNDELIFDEVPTVLNSMQKIFLSHLQPLLKYVDCKNRLPKFLTTRLIARRLLAFYQAQNSKNLTWKNFFILKPYKEIVLTLCNKERIYVMACASDDSAGNAMYLIRKDKVVLHCYCANFADIHTAMLNDNFCDWVGNGVTNLYINAMNADLSEELYAERNLIDEIYSYLKIPTLNYLYVIVGDLGYERFIGLLGKRFSGRVFLDHFLSETYSPKAMRSMKNFTQQSETSKIIVTTKKMSEVYKKKQTELHNIFIELKETNVINTNCNVYLQRHYLPYPNNIELAAIISVLNPKCPYGINSEGASTNLPKHLQFIEPLNEQRESVQNQEQQEQQQQTCESQKQVGKDETEVSKTQTQTSGFDVKNVLIRKTRSLNYVDDTSNSSLN